MNECLNIVTGNITILTYCKSEFQQRIKLIFPVNLKAAYRQTGIFPLELLTSRFCLLKTITCQFWRLHPTTPQMGNRNYLWFKHTHTKFNSLPDAKHLVVPTCLVSFYHWTLLFFRAKKNNNTRTPFGDTKNNSIS